MQNLIKNNPKSVINLLPKLGIKKLQEEIYQGLNAKKKFLSPKFFYDEKGSELFEKITQLEEYYPTRTEKEILSSLVYKTNINLKHKNIIELGSGDASKITLIYNQLDKDTLKTIHYYPIDISISAIEKAIIVLKNKFPQIKITGIVADFMSQLNELPHIENRLYCFFGSTIGNFTPEQARDFIISISKNMNKGDLFLLGLDMIKDINIIEKAYNDSKGITAKFNKNILNVVNKIIKSNFQPDLFEHLAFFNKKHSRIEMHLVAKQNLKITFSSGYNPIYIKKNETIHTENSYKFTVSDINNFAKTGNFSIKQIFTDENNWFSLALFEKN